MNESEIKSLSELVVRENNPDWIGHPMSARMSYSQADVAEVVAEGITKAIAVLRSRGELVEEASEAKSAFPEVPPFPAVKHVGES